MLKWHIFYNVLIVLFCLFDSIGGGKNIYCVKPSHQDSSVECKGLSCEYLYHYASNASQYFTDDTILVFLEGIHTLNVSINVENLNNLKLTGEITECSFDPLIPTNKPQITCTSEVGLTFQYISNLILTNLAFTECGQPVTASLYNAIYGRAQAALGFNFIENLMLHSVVVHNSSGYGILTHNIHGNSSVMNCDLQYNIGATQYRGGNAHFNFTECPATITENHIRLIINYSNFSYGGYSGAFNDTAKTGTFATGIALTLSCTNITVLMYEVTLESNKNAMELGYGGNLFVHFYNETGYISNRVSINKSHFLYGNSFVGAGIGVTLYIGASKKQNLASPSCINEVSIVNSTLNYNEASSGSGVYIDFIQDIRKNECTAHFILKDTTLNYNKIIIAKNREEINSVGAALMILGGYHHGIVPRTYGISLDHITMNYNKVSFQQNHFRIASGNAALCLIDFLGDFLIKDSAIQHNNAAGISAFHSHLKFGGDVVISDNIGINGGGMVLCESADISFTPNTTLSFIGNHARHSGGGIFAEEHCPESIPLCFYKIDGTKYTNCHSITKTATDSNIRVVMHNNTAQYAGSQIYGGSVDSCYTSYHYKVTTSYFHSLFDLKSPPNDLSPISSAPERVCFCNDTSIDCSQTDNIKEYSESVFPGESISVNIVVVGQMKGAVPGQVKVNTSSHLNLFNTTIQCSPIRFPTRSCKSEVVYEFEVFSFADNNLYYTIGQAKYLKVYFDKCPSGFVKNECICNCYWEWKRIKCDFESMKITRESPAWIGWHNNDYLIYHKVCPYDYCRKGTINMSMTRNGTFDHNLQCLSNRIGLLCGACRKGLSVETISSECLDCSEHSSAFLALNIIGRGVCGIVLIFLLFLLNWTITDGTLSGFLFYANIFQINRFLFLPNRAKTFVSVLISWVNLNFYLSSCFYDGMDAYAKSWLSFVFPIYLWTLIGAIILLSRRFLCISTLFGSNAVKVLVTLIELTYSGLLEAVIISLSFTALRVPTNEHHDQKNHTTHLYVWLFDGNVSYLKGKHIPLFIFGAVIALLILAHTLVLLFIQPLQKYSHYRCFSWIAKLKPVIDAYTALHVIKEKCRYWTGLLLAVRLFLMLAFAANVSNEKNINLTAIILSCLFLLTVAWSVGGVYKKSYLNILNASHIVNLAVSSLLILQEEDTSVTIAYFSVSVAFLTMFCVLVYRVYQRVKLLMRACKLRRLRYMEMPQDILDDSDQLPKLRSTSIQNVAS